MDKIIFIVISIVLVACGGGGSSGGSNNGASSVMHSSSQATLEPSINPISVVMTPVSRANTPYFSYALLDTFDFAKSYPQDIRELIADLDLLKVGETSGECENKNGRYSIKLNSQRSKLIENYTQCDLGTGSIINGIKSTEVIIGSEENHIIQIFDKVKIRSVLNTEEFDEFDGKIEFIGRQNESNVLFDVTITTQEEGTLKLKEAVFTFGVNSDGGLFSGVVKMSGKAEWVGQGGFEFNFDKETKVVKLKGSTASSAQVSYENGIFISWDEEDDGQGDAQLFTQNRLGDLLTSQGRQIISTSYPEYKLNQPVLYFARGSNITIDISKAYTNTSLSLLDYSVRVDGDINPNGNWIQTELGKFQLSFPNNTEDRFYDLVFVIKDTQNTVFEVPTKLFVGSDFDRDLVPDMFDQDDDNDLTKDEEDLYPFDPTQIADTDGDGWSDNKDFDADNDGVPNFVDANPLDSSNCKEREEQCYSSFSHPVYLDENGILFFELWNPGFQLTTFMNTPTVNRLDITLGQFLPPIPISTNYYRSYYFQNDKIYYSASLNSSNESLYMLRSVDINSLEENDLFRSKDIFILNYVAPTHVVISTVSNIASYNFDGELINSVQYDPRLQVLPYEMATNCEKTITTASDGNFFVFEDYLDKCASGAIPSPSKNYIYANRNVYSHYDSSLETVLQDHFIFNWIGENYLISDRSFLRLFNIEGVAINEFVVPENEQILSILKSTKTIVVASVDINTQRTYIRIFDYSLVLTKSIQI